MIGHRCIQPNVDKVKKLHNAPPPHTKKDTRSFLELAGFYEWFVKDCNTIAAPLFELTLKSAPVKVNWTPECKASFQTVKTCMNECPVLHLLT